MASNAVAGGKELVGRAHDAGLAAQLEAERNHFVENLFHANAAEGLRAFFEKRPPRFD